MEGDLNINQVTVENFCLLHDVEFGFEDRAMLIVGRNNSGKISESDDD